MKPGTKNSYKSLSDIEIDKKKFKFYSLKKAEENGLAGISKLPKSLKVLLENLLRYEDELSVTKSQIEAIKTWIKDNRDTFEMFAWFWGANTLMATFLIIVYKSMLQSCLLI